jgi:acyl-CoA reductase-like NAD-dependent aldehyde dehydrogenase
VAAALLAGCTIVAKPAPETPLEAQSIAECAEAVGLPPGVLNVVPAGRDIGDYLTNRPGIDKVSFTGSVAGGKRIAEVCAKRLARYTLELGGKSPAVIMDDADLSTALGAIEDAIRIANSSTYGLSGAVFTKDPEKGLALARRIRTGNVTVNGLNLQINAPFGGYKESGIGRVGGPEALEGYQEIKSVYLPA